MRTAPAAFLAAALVLLAGCSASPQSSTDVSLPPAGAVVDYQLGGGYEPADGVGGVARDSTDIPAPGLYSVCYINGFQTQPADRDLWLDDRADLVLTGTGGEPVIDENWPDELILDTSSDDKRDRIAGFTTEVFAGCADAGFDAVEIDNLDSYTRSDGALTDDDAIALATLYAESAHALGLAIAQKNAVELGTRGRDDAGFDFAVAEECQRFDECDRYTEVYGEHVIDIEYTDDLLGEFADVCADPQVPASTILRDRDLTTPDSPEYVFESC
ncbi:hypothetical protein HD599_002231 [Conyzicola lurida]|uniref:Glycoside-hydrolase family GH114 TIM-barrel domain-containing protein n=1 Tax=Conyzicola lurida TaxID=1172621 RepID=A0A841ANJ7_9MICO|nr:hypothetical protein [Conyzicola lurida]